MGYQVRPSGRLHLPEADDAAAVAAFKRTPGPGFNPDEWPPNDTLENIAWMAAAAVTRDGDWIEFSYDDEGDPKWSESATAFYVAIAPYVRSGSVEIEGEDGAQWSYTYVGGKVTQQGWNGWDGSTGL